MFRWAVSGALGSTDGNDQARSGRRWQLSMREYRPMGKSSRIGVLDKSVEVLRDQRAPIRTGRPVCSHRAAEGDRAPTSAHRLAVGALRLAGRT